LNGLGIKNPQIRPNEMKIDEYIWLSLVFVFIFFVHVSLGGHQVFDASEIKKTQEEQINSAEIFKNIKLRKAIV
jgi:hypothetical protein